MCPLWGALGVRVRETVISKVYIFFQKTKIFYYIINGVMSKIGTQLLHGNTKPMNQKHKPLIPSV